MFRLGTLDDFIYVLDHAGTAARAQLASISAEDLRQLFVMSTFIYVWDEGQGPLGIFGLRSSSFLDTTAEVWLLTVAEEQYSKFLCRRVRHWLKLIPAYFTELTATTLTCDNRHFAKLMGLEPIGPDKLIWRRKP